MSAHEETCNALAICLLANAPVVLWGAPGQGKTSVVEQIAVDQGLHLETVIASIREPSDFAGLPIVDMLDKTITLAPPRWARSVTDAERGLIFFDEISTAPPAVQAAMLRVVLDRVVGDLPMSKDVRIVAAANPPEMAADGWDLSLPMANRFTHLDWTLPPETVRDGFTMGWPTVELPQIDVAEAERQTVKAKLLVGTFIGVRPELTTKVPTSSTEGGRGYPTPRSWESAATLYGYAMAAGASQTVINMLLIGTIGLAATQEFTAYVANLDLPDPEALLADPESLVVPSNRGDKVYAIGASVWAATNANNTKERWVACGVILAKIADAGHADIAFTMGGRWAKARPSGAMPAAVTAKSLGPILAELNLISSKG